MKLRRWINRSVAIALAAFSVSAMAQPSATCEVAFTERSITITLLASDLGAGLSVAGTEEVSISARRDSGRQAACPTIMRMSRVSNATEFPNFVMTASNQPITPAANEAAGGPDNQRRITVSASSDRKNVSLRAVAATEWGLVAGRQTEQLQLSLIGLNGTVLDRIPLYLELDVPKTVDVMFAGSTGGGQASSIELGNLSQTETVRSQPFEVRIWSSSGYDFVFRSENAGTLVHRQGMDTIPYSLLVNGQSYALGGAPLTLSEGTASAKGGDTYGLTISVPARRSVAGEYQDRLTVTVTAI